MEQLELVQSAIIKVSAIEENKGQIDGLPENPRIIRDDRYKKLKNSILENPEMMSLRELLVFEHGGKYVIIGGNMRYKAIKEIGYEYTICKIIPAGTPVETLRAYTIKDNSGFGEWDFDILKSDFKNSDLIDWGIEIPELQEIEPDIIEVKPYKKYNILFVIDYKNIEIIKKTKEFAFINNIEIYEQEN